MEKLQTWGSGGRMLLPGKVDAYGLARDIFLSITVITPMLVSEGMFLNIAL